MSATITTIIAIIAGIAFFSPLYPIIFDAIRNYRKLRLQSKSGEIVELDFRKKNSAAKVIRALDILLED
ncbi:hypothetical protein F0L74_28385 [Chitinophaga agrisoli]|uniref:Uncharacterized protein n=1 Tax=Chitinophaga agrisoli TaxID=2607653 RepID=A0A5B2VM31_9BACT|nr:hypothetical protein [Chitinophaga agrisoli]KAA2240091.1 hypothetical protein F0L74_28385 [Chitinophaga agrisoli]